MKSPLNIPNLVKYYCLNVEQRKKLVDLDCFIWKYCEIRSVPDLLAFEKEYQTKKQALGSFYDKEIDEYVSICMCDGTLDYLSYGTFQKISKCIDDNISQSFQSAGLTELETIIIRSFLADISGLYRQDAYHVGLPPFVKFVCYILNNAIAKFPVYTKAVVRACNDYDKDDFRIGDVFTPNFCLTASADLTWEDTSVNRYYIAPIKDSKTKARAIFNVKDTPEKQVTFLQDAKFRIVNVKKWGDGNKEFIMEEIIYI